MRGYVIVLNSIATLFFIGFLTYSFLAKQNLEDRARQFVTEKTLQYSRPVFDLAEQSLKQPLVRKRLPAAHLATIRKEIADYHRAPTAYIADLTRQAQPVMRPQKVPPLQAKIADIKTQIRAFYHATLEALIEDLRIFAICNLCAILIALGLTVWSRKRISQSRVWFSFLMLLSVLYCSYLYIDNLTFFRILFQTHMGWWYAFFLSLMLLAFYIDYGHTN